MDTTIVIDGIVIVLLAATILSAFRLERKLEGLRNAQTAFADVTKELNAAAARAEASVRGLKSAAESSGQALDDRIKRARSVGDELAMLLQAGQRASERTDGARAPTANMGEAWRVLGGMR